METLDCIGMRCPLPIIKLARALVSMPLESQILLLSDDPASEPDLRAWARMTGNGVQTISSDTFEVTKLAD